MPDPARARRRRLRPSVVALGAGLLLFGAFPPIGLRPLAIIAVALHTLLLRRRPARSAFVLGLVTGLGFFVPLLTWMLFAGVVPWLVVSLLQALFVALLSVGVARVTRLRAWPAWVAALWVLEEALRSRLPLGGFTWGRLGFSQDAGPLARWAMVAGVPGVTLLTALTGALLAVGAGYAIADRDLFGPRARRRGSIAVALAVVLVCSGWLLVLPGDEGRTTTAALVQGNVPRLGLDAFEQERAVTRNHTEATEQLATDVAAGRLPRPDLVLWPENAADNDPRTDAETRDLLTRAAQAVNQPILVGAVLDAPDDRALNAGMIWRPDGSFELVYVKRHLVPYGEYVPLRSVLQPVFGQLAQIPRDFAPGTRPGVLEMSGVRIGDVICFEVAYDDLVRDVVQGGAELIVVQTNNATFERSAETKQQLAMSRLRALEHARSVLVVATSGVSAVIAPDGRILDRSAVFSRDVLVETVPLRRGRTLATRVGIAPEVLVSLAALVSLALTLRLPRRRRQADAEPAQPQGFTFADLVR